MTARELIELANDRLATRKNEAVYRTCFSCLDLTMLGNADTQKSVTEFAERAARFPIHFPNIAPVASLCVYPLFVDAVGVALGNSRLAIASVAGGFPAAQTYLEVKMLEVSMAVENGADEIDIVMPAGEVLEGVCDQAMGEIAMIKAEVGEEIILKVILETGCLQTEAQVFEAAMAAMRGGADFIKTSTGKCGQGATPEAVVAMCNAIKAYHAETGRAVGIKVSGGVRSVGDAVLYYTLVEELLGAEWLTPERFRIGASGLANALLSAIEGREIVYF